MLLHDSINVKKIVTMMLGQQRLLRSSLLFRLSSQQQQLFQYRTMFGSKKIPPPAVMGDESIMSKKAHGTSETPVQENLRWGCDQETADRICNFNRHYAEHSGYFEGMTKFMDEARSTGNAITFYDSNTGLPLFIAPRGRSMEDFLVESRAHGWPSFRDQEVNWEQVRVLPDGETVSLAGTHLGHNLPDSKGSRYCINLVSVAGNPK